MYNLEKKINADFISLIRSNLKDFVFLVFLIIIEILLFSTSILSVIPIVDLIVDPKLINPSKITFYTIKLFQKLSLKINLTNFILLFFSFEFLKIISSIFLVKKILDLRFNLQERLFNNLIIKISYCNYIFFEKNNDGSLINTLSILIKKIGAAYAALAIKFANIFKFFILLLIPLLLNPEFVILSFIVLIIMFLPIKFLSSLNFRLGKKVTKDSNHLIDSITETLKSRYLLFIFQKHIEQQKKVIENLIKLNSNDKKSLIINSAISNSSRPIAIIALGISFFIYIHFFEKNFLLSEMSSVFWGLISAAPCLSIIAATFIETKSLLPCLQQYVRIFNEAKSLQLPKPNLGKKKFLFNKYIEFKNIEFLYNKKKIKLFKNLNLKFLKNNTTLIVGKSGIGKSTLIDLLLRYKNYQKGKILVDDNDLKEINLNLFLANIGYLSQSSFLFNCSIKKNLTWVNSNITDKICIEALKLSNAYNFVRKLKGGINFSVGDNGLKLSGGERQRICLARTLISNPDIVILDEPTNNLDNISKRNFVNAINKLRGKKTIIIITHDNIDNYLYDKKYTIK